MNTNIYIKNYAPVFSKEVLTDASMEITVEMIVNGEPIKQTAIVSYKEVLARATPDELREFLTELMIKDMVRQTEITALAAVTK